MPFTPDSIFSSLSNDTRRRCLLLLMHYGELCVCELTHALEISQPHVSRHLALLRESGLVSDRRAGLWVYYRINQALPDWVKRLLRDVFEGLASQPPYRDDIKLLTEMPNRPDAPRCSADGDQEKTVPLNSRERANV